MSIFAFAAASGEIERTAVWAHPTTLHLVPLEILPNSEMTTPLPRHLLCRTYSRITTEFDIADKQLSPAMLKRHVHRRRVGSSMFGRFREMYENAMLPLGRVVAGLGISPNMISVIAAFVSLGAAVLYFRGAALIGACVLLVSAFLDMVDGAVARATKTASRFGAVLDHVLDRYVEYVVVVGIVAGGFANWFWGAFALIGMLLASYARAAAESVGGLDSCTVGIAERQEKLLLIVAGSALTMLWQNALEYSLILVGLLSHFTVGQRLLYTREKARAS